MEDDMVADDMVYVRRGKYWEAAKVDGFYFNCNAEQCVSTTAQTQTVGT